MHAEEDFVMRHASLQVYPQQVPKAMMHCIPLEGTSAADYGYVALHGTGTPLGDPIEMGALGQALAGSSGSRAAIAIGSVKSCYGHTEGAAGLTGALLAISALQTGVSG